MYAVLVYDVANKMLCQFKMMERYYFIKCKKKCVVIRIDIRICVSFILLFVIECLIKEG